MAKSMPPLIEVRSAKARGAPDDPGGKILGGGLVVNHGPVDDDLQLHDARPFHEADRDLAQCS
jgi:hypothetical protein